MQLFRVILALAILVPIHNAAADNAVVAQTQSATALTAGRQAGDPATTQPLPRRPVPRRQSFHDLVRNLVAAHEVQPLKSVLEVARKASAGEVVSIKLRRQKIRWVYHVRMLQQDGRRAELEIDGKSLKILERK